MTRAVMTLAITLALAAGTARAADKAPAPAAPAAAAPSGGMPDMTKMGPLSRAVTKQDKKGIDELYKSFEDAMMKGDVAAAADLCDFPIIMLSDDSKGVAKSFNASREQWVGIFTPFATNRPKDMKMSSKHTPTFLSDTLAVSIEQTSMSAGKMKGKYNAMAVVTLIDGKWKFKQMAEAGWGDMPAGPTAAASPSAAPAMAKAPGAAPAGPVAKAPAPPATAPAKK
jgi:ketosteroid isomerase-like protein